MVNKIPFVESQETKKYKNIIEELTVTANGLILRNSKLVIPTSLQKRIIEIAHEGHLGTSKTKAILRENVWFPDLNKKVEEFIKNCLACLATTKQDEHQEIHCSDMPNGSWETVAIDFYGPVYNVYLMVVICLYSRFVVVNTITSTSSSNVTKKLNNVFSILGSPQAIKSDNGPPFNGYQSKAQKSKLSHWSFKFQSSLETITIHHIVPQGLPKFQLALTPDNIRNKAESNHEKSMNKVKENNKYSEKQLECGDSALVKQKQTNKTV
ncbi:unnamed protein product [Brachionus calyciflorus]|uniref:Integrase catalytic domain-containing protein n=1 Tax=Brachionus calyciflorus TaxID=104777 RepID=A0A814HTJ5_9BILA|nr:unnamed protein product [Brachionus calyciflorus]